MVETPRGPPPDSPAPDSPPASCANCGATLRGPYCHSCGQSEHNPVRQVSHALEEVFESFVHLDGRIFRTLRDLPFPGRVANRYLGGHRVGYVAPLRLFVVLSVLTFLLAQAAMQVAMHNHHGLTVDSIEAAATSAEVQRIRDQTIAKLQEGRAELEPGGIGHNAMDAAIAQVNAAAERRLAELQAVPAAATSPPAPAEEQSAAATESPEQTIHVLNGLNVQIDATHPLRISWLPGFVVRWLTGEMQRIEQNAPRIRQDPNLLVHAFLSAVPRTLFVLVPLFALLLTLAYVGSGRMYLEHLVVALYSHAWICLTILVISLLSVADGWLEPHAAWASRLGGYVNLVLALALPVYLLAMQKLVYRERWGRTLLKYFAVGSVYTVIVWIAALVLVMLSLANV